MSDYLKLQRERDDYMERFRIAISERDSWRMRAEQKYAMRRELEELLGVDRNDASDEQFQKGLDAIKNIIRERDEAREVASGLAVQEERVEEAQKELSSIHRWIERNHPDGFIDSMTYHQNLERVGDRWYDQLDQVERERNDYLDRLNEILKPIPIK
jgi:hypothetical protein